jgi:hypothetical protein
LQPVKEESEVSSSEHEQETKKESAASATTTTAAVASRDAETPTREEVDFQFLHQQKNQLHNLFY